MNLKQLVFVLLGALSLVSPGWLHAAQSPNVIIILVDDLGYGDLGCYGATKVKTPHIDKLAAEGRRFTDAHSASAVCTPSRYALLTGEYPMRANNGKGVWGPAPVTSGLMIDPDKLTVADVFKRKGYATAVLGKWHLGFKTGTNDWQEPLRPGPQDLGFDYYFGIPVVSSAPPYVWVENDHVVGGDPADPLVYVGRNGKGATPITPIPPEASQRTPNRFKGAVRAHKMFNPYEVGTVLAEKAVAWIAANKQKPFFLYLATPQIHHPFTPGKRFQGSSQCGLYGDFIQELDWMVGEVLKCLDENDLADNTLVIFTSDNGGMFNTGAQAAFQAGHQINGDLLGFKFGVWEGGQRVPFIARWPGRIKAGTQSDQLICLVDMLATFAALTGQNMDEAALADSVNILPALTGEPASPVRDQLVLAPWRASHLSVREGKWMYIPAQGSGGWTGAKPGMHTFAGPAAATYTGHPNSDIENGKIKKDAPPAQLYDLETDVGESNNVIRAHAEVAARMKARLMNLRLQPGTVPTLRATVPAAPLDGDAGYPVDFTYRVAIARERGVTRRDPSDVIKVDGEYFVWYSRVTKGPNVPDYPSGYSAEVWYATSPDGRQWTEQGRAIGKGAPGAWDARGVFTPNILRFAGKYYLYYTAVGAGHDNAIPTPTHIGVAVADSPAGPWRKFTGNPVLAPSADPAQFDSSRVDDAALLVREGKVWLYYKGRTKGKGPGETKMGVAFADSPTGPFTKHGEPLHPGHEVMVWPQGKGVASLATAAGPRRVYYAADGLHFEPRNAVNNPPRAPGAWRTDTFENNANGRGLEWGISHASQGGDLYLMRFDATRTIPDREER